MEETKDITPIMKEALRVLKLLIRDIKEGRCSEDELADALTKFHPKSNTEYFRKEDYCNADEAMRYLGIRSRNQFFELMREHGIANHKQEFKDMGYYRGDLESFRKKMKSKL